MIVYHLSDIHIRNGDSVRARADEYSVVFQRFLTFLKADYKGGDGDKDKKAILVITGDLFHNKNKLEPVAIKLFYDLAIAIGDILPIFIIRGNHDYMQYNTTDLDLIGSLVIPELPGVNYLDSTGVFDLEDLGFDACIGLLAIQDVLKAGNTSASVKAFPTKPFPYLNKKMMKKKHKIALFHGTLPGNHAGFFDGYDVALLGDVHEQRVYSNGAVLPLAALGPNQTKDHVTALYCKKLESKGVTCGYAGSMIRQNLGEEEVGHGFLKWDLVENTVTAYHILNVVQEAKNERREPNILTALNNRERERERERDHTRKPHQGGEADGDGDGSRKACDGDDNDEDGSENEEPSAISSNSPQDWINFINEKDWGEIEKDAWKKYILQPELLIDLFGGCPAHLKKDLEKKLAERTEKVKKKHMAYVDAIGETQIQTRPFRFIKMAWDWVLCYGPDNHFDFGVLDGKLSVLSGRNGHGKTSFLETILLVLYGTGFPSRNNRHHSASIISTMKPKNGVCKIVMTLMLASTPTQEKEMVRITRHFYRQEDGLKLHSSSKQTLVDIFRQPDQERKSDNQNPNQEIGWININSGKTAVDKWVNANIGEYDSFLLSCMVSQNADNDFFNMKGEDQREMLDRALNVGTHTRYMELLKESRLAHLSIADAANITITSLMKRGGGSGGGGEEGDKRLLDLESLLVAAATDAAVAAASANTLSKTKRATLLKQLMDIEAADDTTVKEWNDEASMLKKLKLPFTVRKPSLSGVGDGFQTIQWYQSKIDEMEKREGGEGAEGNGNDCGFDSGPYNDSCSACCERKAAKIRRDVSEQGRVLQREYTQVITYLQKVRLDELGDLIEKAEIRSAAVAMLDASPESGDGDGSKSGSEGNRITWLLEKQRLESIRDEATKVKIELESWTLLKSIMEKRATIFAKISEHLDGFVAHLYETKVIPKIQNFTNHVMGLIDPNLTLEGKMNKGALEWTIANAVGNADGSIRPPIEKASGFQRFICGLAVRMALGSSGVGAASTKPAQLFLDEGFTSCDSVNLAKVPHLLNTLLQLYNGILLVTHLEDLKDDSNAAMLHISRDEDNGYSQMMR